MTILQAIAQTDNLMQNTFSVETKAVWLSRLDAMVKRLVIDTHEGGEAVTFQGYDRDTPTGTELLVPEPFDEMYLRWLEAQIHYHNADYDAYNNSVLRFNSVFEEFANDYHRSHLPKQTGRFRF